MGKKRRDCGRKYHLDGLNGTHWLIRDEKYGRGRRGINDVRGGKEEVVKRC